MAYSAGDIEAKQEAIGSEAQALADIVAWSKDCPTWQRDALRRLCTKGALDDADLDELTVLCRSQTKGGAPLSAEHVPDPEATTTIVNLSAIHSVQNVNALKPRERLTFDEVGLTVVHGDNGSGKSGYARILKKVCRARVAPKGDKILPNIYASETGPQGAIVNFSVNGQKRRKEWTAGDPSDPLLSAVNVFDGRAANVHVDEANDVAYTPFPIRVLERLAEACRKIKDRIGTEIRELKKQTPETITVRKYHVETEVGKLIAGLNGGIQEKEVRNLAKLSEKDKERLKTLRADLGKDPAKMAGQVEALRNRLDAVAKSLETLQGALGDEQVRLLKGLHQTYRTARDAASVAAGARFSNDLLPGISSPVWRKLWEAARCYSEQQAYPGVQFPFTEKGARCVLCQQELDERAADRINHFEDFVKDETQRKEEQAKAAYQEALKAMANAKFPAKGIPAVVSLIRDELHDDGLAASARRIVVMLKWRFRAVLRSHAKGEDALPPPVADAWPAEAIAAHSAGLSDRITALRAKDKSGERKKMRAEREELAGREWLALVQEDVIAEIGRRKARATLAAILKDTTTNRITMKSSEIAGHLVTNALHAQFSREISKFDSFNPKIELHKAKTSYGVPYFQVSLIRKPDAQVGEILSEGEHRCVALAAFLAELATTASRSAIVFDDPVSSLDHMHLEAVAERLAEEARHRQVVAFTHDTTFLLSLEQACRDKGTRVTFRTVTRTEDYTGIVQEDLLARAKSVERAIRGMQKRFNNEKRFYDNGDHVKWEQTVGALQNQLRSTWERAVEEVLRPVIKRLSSKVNIREFAKVTALTKEDSDKMLQAYRQCSKQLHSSPAAMNRSFLKPEAVEQQITSLRNWLEDITQRQAKIG